MSVRFDPRNSVVQLCMKGMALEENENVEEAMGVFQQAWDQANTDFEKFIAAYHLGLRQKNVNEKLAWIKKSLQAAQKINDETVKSAYPTLYLNIAQCYEEVNDDHNVQKNTERSQFYQGTPTDDGPFYHGTKAALQIGDLLKAGEQSNYEEGFKMNHIYFAANIHVAGLAASLAKGEGKERVYIVEPTGGFEHDPNVTNKRFPGNLTRSYRSSEPLKMLGEVTDWEKLTEAKRQEWEEKLAKNKGEIIN